MHAVALAASLLTLSGSALASIRVVTDAELARASAAAVHGLVTAVEVRAEGAIYTYVTLDVWQAWGLDLPARVVVKQLGGQLGDAELHIGGQARFDIGEEVFLFLEVRPRDGTLMVAGLEQGKWSVRDFTSTGSPAAVREPHASFVPQPTVVDRRGLAELEAMAQQVAGAAPAFVSEPPELQQSARAVPAYAFFPNPARWHEADTGQSVYVDSQAGGHPQFPGGGLTQLARAATMWRDASSLNVQAGVQRSARCWLQLSSEGRISVTYGDPCGEIVDSSNTLAIGGYWATTSVMRTVNGISFRKIRDGAVVVDNTASKFQNMSLGCYEQMIVHEIGHAIGFDHSTSSSAIMRPVIGGCSGRTTSNALSADDLAGLAVAYPRATPQVPLPDAPSSFSATASGSTLVVSWSAVSGPVSEYVLEAGTAMGASNLGSVSTGLQTTFSAPVAPGRYYLRVRARNVTGLGPASVEASVLVAAPAAPPPAPQGFVATSAGSTVTLQWTAPVGAAPLGYRVEAGSQQGLSNVGLFPVSGTSMVVVGVPPGIYYVRVRALGPGGASPPSDEAVLVVHAAGLPGAPGGLTWSVDSARTVTLAWQPPTSGESPMGYALEAGSSLGQADIVPPAFLGLTTTFVVPAVPPGAYFVRVRAVTAAGMGGPSNEILVIVP